MAASNEGVENGAGAGARDEAAAPALGVVLAGFGFIPVTLSFDIRHVLPSGYDRKAGNGNSVEEWCLDCTALCSLDN